MGNIKYCKDCKHYERIGYHPARCKRTKYYKQTDESMVEGIYRYSALKTCDEYRGLGECGRDAKYFSYKNIFKRLIHHILN